MTGNMEEAKRIAQEVTDRQKERAHLGRLNVSFLDLALGFYLALEFGLVVLAKRTE